MLVVHEATDAQIMLFLQRTRRLHSAHVGRLRDLWLLAMHSRIFVCSTFLESIRFEFFDDVMTTAVLVITVTKKKRRIMCKVIANDNITNLHELGLAELSIHLFFSFTQLHRLCRW